jgi:hypothetical protein
MDRRFLGSPACFYLITLTFEIIYLAIYLGFRTSPPAVAGLFVICDVFIGVFLIAYARSLYWIADFPGRVVFYCMGQAIVSGLGFAVPISIGIFRAWEPWGYVLLAWGVTLLINFAFDFLLVGLHWYKMPVSQFTIRAQ